MHFFSSDELHFYSASEHSCNSRYIDFPCCVIKHLKNQSAQDHTTKVKLLIKNYKQT